MKKIFFTFLFISSFFFSNELLSQTTWNYGTYTGGSYPATTSSIFSANSGNVYIGIANTNSVVGLLYKSKFNVLGNTTLMGNVGIGVMSPTHKLHVSAGTSYFTGNVGIGIEPTSTSNHVLSLYRAENPAINLKAATGRMEIGVANCDGCFANGITVGTTVIRTMGPSYSTVLFIPTSSTVGDAHIGIGDPNRGVWAKFLNNGTFRVDGTIYAKEIRVQTNVWSDFVFDSNYNLRPLSEVESFINKNKHLPEIPSANQVIEEGIDVAKMNALLLQKVEELTLYVIELNKELQEMKKSKN